MFKGKNQASMHQSPLKEKQLKSLSEDQKQVLHELENLFTYYASKFDRLSYHELSQKGFNEIISKLLKKDKSSASKSPARNQKTDQQLKEKEMQRSLQLLYYSKGNTRAATFDQLLDMIPQMANIVYQSMNKDERVQLMTSDLRFLYKREVLTLLNGKLINISFVLREDTYNYAIRLLPEFEKIYKVYFAHELNRNIKKTKYKDESLKFFFTFLKDFEVMPKLVTAGEAYFIYDEANRNPQSDCFNEPQAHQQEFSQQRPVCFSLGKFVTCLIIVARNCYGKLRQLDSSEEADINEKQAFKALLQEIEMNKAYKNSRHLKQTNQTYSFILLDEYPKEYELAKSRRTFNNEGSKGMEKKGSSFIQLLNNMDI